MILICINPIRAWKHKTYSTGWGIIIWCACHEGFGQKVSEEWLINKKPKEIIADIKDRFILGGTKQLHCMVWKGQDFYGV